jgi:phosphoesterase RecJ-like protein
MVKEIIDSIRKGKSFLITAHIRLDGDALGSELALYLLLRDLGKKAVVYNQDNTPAHYRFLPAEQSIVHELGDIEQYDSAFILDCSELERVGDQAEKIGRIKKLINIDHHISNGGFSKIRMLDAQASSTGELLFRLMQEMRYPMTKDICTNLYAAIITDTGGFRYSNTRRETFLAAGSLVENGADPQWISEHIYESDPPAKLRLLAKTMETMSLDLDRKIGSLVVTRALLEETGASVELTDGFVDIPRSVSGIEIAVLYTEMDGNYFKLSMRSKGKVNVEKIARKFGGGGHVNAAACRIKGNIETIKLKIQEAIGAM